MVDLASDATPKRRDGCGRAAEVAEFLGVSERTLWRWAREEGFPKPLNFLRYTAWRWEVIYAWLDERAAASASK